MTISEKKLDFWISQNKNVLFIGKSGVGKSAQIIEAMKRNGIRYKYFSGSTMDPWIEFIGIPEKVTDDQGAYIEIIPPKDFRFDDIEAIIIDEYNRSKKAVRNGVMELIQFKSINGKKFSNLRMVWAAINPDDPEEKYDVEPLDKAQKDRFHIHCYVDYKPDTQYLKTKYPAQIVEGAVEWWEQLPEGIKNEVSPRRLDETIQYYMEKGDLYDMLPSQSNIPRLIYLLGFGSVKSYLENLWINQSPDNAEEARQFLASPDNYAASIGYILDGGSAVWDFFLPLLTPDNICALLSDKDNPHWSKVVDYFIAQSIHQPFFAERIKEYVKTHRKMDFVTRHLKSKINSQFDPKIIESTFGKSFIKIKSSLNKRGKMKPKKKHLTKGKYVPLSKSNANGINSPLNLPINTATNFITVLEYKYFINTSYKRRKTYEFLTKYIPHSGFKFNMMESFTLLKWCGDLLTNSSPNNVIVNMGDLFDVINYSISSIAYHEGINPEDIYEWLEKTNGGRNIGAFAGKIKNNSLILGYGSYIENIVEWAKKYNVLDKLNIQNSK